MLATVVFGLICMGGAVTTYDAGMAVPDWPTTNSYWFYPVKAWLAVWDVFLEHGHRLLGQAAGLLAIALAATLWRCDDRRWMRWVAAAILLGVVVQGSLGGLRVLDKNRVLARVHGCIAPLYFGLCAAAVAWTSRAWWSRRSRRLCFSITDAGSGAAQPDAVMLKHNLPPESVMLKHNLHVRLAWLVTGLLYAEIVLGAELRRPAAETAMGAMDFWVWLKVINAGLIVVLAGWLVGAILRRRKDVCRLAPRGDFELPEQGARKGERATGRQDDQPTRGAVWLAAILLVQLVLAGATWVANYGWPEWTLQWIGLPAYTVVAQGRLVVLVTTAHAAVGSLALAASLNVALWLARFARP